MGSFLGATASTSGDTTIPALYGKPPLTSEPNYKRGDIIGLNVGCGFNQSKNKLRDGQTLGQMVMKPNKLSLII